MTWSITYDNGGTFNGSSAFPNSSEIGTIQTTAANQIVLICLIAGRENTSTDFQRATTINPSGGGPLTSSDFVKVFSQDYSFVDSTADPSFSTSSMHMDVFAALAPTQVSGQSWTSSYTGDNFINNGAGFIFGISGAYTGGTVQDIFDANASNFKFASQLSGSSSSPSVTGFSTNDSNPFLIMMTAQHNLGGGSPAAVAGPTGWTTTFDPGIPENNNSGSNFRMGIDTLAPGSAQSNQTYTLTSSDTIWGTVVFALASAAPASNTWASVEAPDTMAFVGFAGAPGITGELSTTEVADSFAAAGYPAAVGTWATTDGQDTFSAFGRQPIDGHMASTENPDTFAGTGVGFGETLILASTEAPDVFAAKGTVIEKVEGTFNATETSDSFHALGAGANRSTKRPVFFVT